MSILSVMLVSILILLFRPRNHIRPLPRQPVTLASILVYLASERDSEGTALLDGFEGLSMLSTKERNECVVGWGGTYGMGIVEGNDLRIDNDRRIRRLWAD